MHFRYLNASGSVCCEANTVAELCDTCRAKAKAENLSTVVVTRTTAIRTAPAAPIAAAEDEQFPPPPADAVARVLAARPTPGKRPTQADILSRMPRPEAVE